MADTVDTSGRASGVEEMPVTTVHKRNALQIKREFRLHHCLALAHSQMSMVCTNPEHLYQSLAPTRTATELVNSGGGTENVQRGRERYRAEAVEEGISRMP